MGSGTILLPTGEYRFISENVSLTENNKLYIDPSTWCIHGKYQTFDKHVLAASHVTALLAQLHPFTLGWIADLHYQSTPSDTVNTLIERLSLCNPCITVFGGDIVSGSGIYTGSDMNDSWFQEVWEYSRDKLSNNLWIKGNHDVDPWSHFYYNWFERLWTVRIGRFTFLAFDAFNEQSVIQGSCDPALSLPDVIWLNRRLKREKLNKVILVHHPLDQWYPHCAWALDETQNITSVYSGHTHDIINEKNPFEKISNIPNYINGSRSDGELRVVTLTGFFKDGREETALVAGGLRVDETPERYKIKAPDAIDWNRQRTVSRIPIRLVRRMGEQYINLIAFLQSESEGSITIHSTDQDMEVSGDMEIYVTGKITAKQAPYDSWTCSCGSVWNSYQIAPGASLKCEPS